MKFHLGIICYVFLILASTNVPGSTGLSFYLDPKVDHQATCGVLHCSEEAKDGNASRISSLTVYRQEDGRRVTLTAVSQEQPFDNSTLNGIVVDARWGSERTEAKLYLVKKSDCHRGHFSCQVSFIDALGNDRVSMSIVGRAGDNSLKASASISEDSLSPGVTEYPPIPAMYNTHGAPTHPVKRRANQNEFSKACALQINSLNNEINRLKTVINGDWTVIQRRSTGKENFYRDWKSYVNGFGGQHSDFWLGNDRIHDITTRAPHELRVTLRYKGAVRFAHYGEFWIGDVSDNYKLHISKYSGNAGDSLSDQNGAEFSTYDRDNDLMSSNCAVDLRGAWWYRHCSRSNLNGEWGASSGQGPIWYALTYLQPATYTEMKIRPVAH